jgi:hypothetical protein
LPLPFPLKIFTPLRGTPNSLNWRERKLQTRLLQGERTPNEQQVNNLLTKSRRVIQSLCRSNQFDRALGLIEKYETICQIRNLSKKDLAFQYCDRRQLKWFQGFFEDQQIKRSSEDRHTVEYHASRLPKGWGFIYWQKFIPTLKRSAVLDYVSMCRAVYSMGLLLTNN